MEGDITFIGNERYTRFPSYRVNTLIWQKKLRSTEEKMERTTSMKTEEA
jgi:hypothetical protein